jgi:hypothetical protein
MRQKHTYLSTARKILCVNFTLLILGIWSVACSTKYPRLDFDPEFYPYIESFNEEVGVFDNGILVFEHLPSPKVGLCYQTRVPLIKIDPTYWSKSTRPGRESVLWHEIGHALNLDHDNSILANGCPNSLMSPIMSVKLKECFVTSRQHYVNDLRGKLKAIRGASE